MDKQTLSGYGWIVIVTLILAVLLALATPFGTYVGDGVTTVVNGFINTNAETLSDDSIDSLSNKWEQKFENGVNNTVPTVYELKKQYDFTYYSTLEDAINTVNTGVATVNAVNEKDAEAGVYVDENGRVNVVLLKNAEVSERMSISTNMCLNLGGKTLTNTNVVTFDVMAGDVEINGKLKNSCIKSNTNRRMIQVQGGTLHINGGKYELTNVENDIILLISVVETTINDAEIYCKCEKNWSRTMQINPGAAINLSNSKITNITNKCYDSVINGGNLTIDKCIFETEITSDESTSGIIESIYNATDGVIKISNSEINTKTIINTCIGIRNYGTLTTENTSIFSDFKKNVPIKDNINYNDMGLYGIVNLNALYTINCNVYGARAGIISEGVYTEINGGLCEGYQIGGAYFVEGTAYVDNATLRHCNLKSGFKGYTETKDSAFYMGDNENEMLNVYINNCELYGDRQPIVMFGDSNDENASLYISNSNIYANDSAKIRIDRDSYKISLGQGNNFTSNIVNKQNLCEQTNEIYTKPE